MWLNQSLSKSLFFNSDETWIFKNIQSGCQSVVYAEIERVCYIADKVFYVKKKGDTQNAKFKVGKND